MSLFINIGATAVCLVVLGVYFNYRERKLQKMADGKLKEIKDSYLDKLAKRKLKEKQEIDKLKDVVLELEKKHKEILVQKNSEVKKIWNKEAEEIVKKAEERAERVEGEIKQDAKKFLEEQKKEVQTKMVDLVMGVTKKVLVKSLNYNEHKKLIEDALKDMEGEIPDEEGN